MIMQTAPELIFHDVDRSAWVESYILERVQRLERFADGITSCRVTLTQEQASHHKGNRYSVMVETRMPPNHDLAAKKAKVGGYAFFVVGEGIEKKSTDFAAEVMAQAGAAR